MTQEQFKVGTKIIVKDVKHRNDGFTRRATVLAVVVRNDGFNAEWETISCLETNADENEAGRGYPVGGGFALRFAARSLAKGSLAIA